MDLTNFDLNDMIECGRALGAVSTSCLSMEAAARQVVQHFRGALVDPASGQPNCALVRCFKTHPLDQLPASLAAYARGMLQGDRDPRPDLPCLTLLATSGDAPQWNDRQSSRRHAAIPLESVEMVQRAPMIASLLQQMGLTIESALSPDAQLILDADQKTFNVFHVEEARDHPSIPAQADFVRLHGIRSVLGFGGFLPGGELFTVIMFSRVTIVRETADMFGTIALGVKLALLPFAHGPVFDPTPGEAAREQHGGRHLKPQDERYLRSEIATLQLLITALEDAALHQTSRLKSTFVELEKQGEMARRQSARLQAMLEATTDAVFLIDRSWCFTFLNRRAQSLIAHGRNLLGLNIWSVFPDSVNTSVQQRYEHVMEQRTAQVFEDFFVPLGLWFAFQAYPTEDGVAVFFRDITRAREDERALQESEHRLRLALEAGRMGTWKWDADTDLLDVDEKAAEIFGWKPHIPITRSALRDRAVVAEDRPLTLQALSETLKGGSKYESEYRVVRDDGIAIWVHSSGTAVYSGPFPERIVGMVGTIQDITERRKQEATLKQTEMLAATGRMAATIAHEINNPLEAVTNLIFLARMSPDLPPAVHQHLKVADEELARIGQIAQQTLGFYRDTSRPQSVVLSSLIAEVVNVFNRRLSYKQIHCEPEFRGDLKIVGLAGELRQAISNLLLNSIDASQSGGLLRIRARAASMPESGEPAVSVTVCDSGSGISTAAMAKLFSPFFTTKESVGTGLGLWVTKGIVEKHGGTICCRSSAKQPSFTVFRIMLPRRGVAGQGLE